MMNHLYPILDNPETLSHDELLKSFRLLQEVQILHVNKLNEANLRLSEMCHCAHDFSVQLWSLVDSFDANDQEAIKVQLQRLSENRKAAQARKPKVH